MKPVLRFLLRQWLVGVLLLASSAARADVDPGGDTFGAGPIFHDITTFLAVGDASGVTFSIDFAGPILPASAFDPISLVGYIDLDADKDFSTGGDALWGGPVPGGNSWINFFVAGGSVPGPPIMLGDEFFVDLFSEAAHPGLVDIVDTTTATPIDTVPIIYSPTGLSFFVGAASLGGDPMLSYGIVIGTYSEPTDRAPNDETPAMVVVGGPVIPEPASVTLLSLGAIGLAGYAGRRKRASV
jgi:hypothetical protein